jgi:DUF1680 family protein
MKKSGTTPVGTETCIRRDFIDAIAHHRATGKRKMLDAALKIADHLVSVYGPDKSACPQP